jgi:hypothetical protein
MRDNSVADTPTVRPTLARLSDNVRRARRISRPIARTCSSPRCRPRSAGRCLVLMPNHLGDAGFSRPYLRLIRGPSRGTLHTTDARRHPPLHAVVCAVLRHGRPKSGRSTSSRGVRAMPRCHARATGGRLCRPTPTSHHPAAPWHGCGEGAAGRRNLERRAAGRRNLERRAADRHNPARGGRKRAAGRRLSPALLQVVLQLP